MILISINRTKIYLCSSLNNFWLIENTNGQGEKGQFHYHAETGGEYSPLTVQSNEAVNKIYFNIQNVSKLIFISYNNVSVVFT